MQTLHLISLPEEGHPLRPLVIAYTNIRNLSLDAYRRMETIAPTPSTFAEDHPADALTGQRKEYYTALLRQEQYYGHCASVLYDAIMATADEFGGF